MGAGDASMHWENLGRLGLGSPVANTWHDGLVSGEPILAEYLTPLDAAGAVRVERREIDRCACGAVELLAGSWSQRHHSSPSFFGGTCPRCEGKLLRTQAPCLVGSFNVDLRHIFVRPSYAEAEWLAISDSFSRQERLISRTAARVAHVEWKGQAWFLDTDFLWMLSLHDLARRGLPVAAVLVGHRTLKHAWLAAALATVLAWIPTAGPSLTVAAAKAA